MCRNDHHSRCAPALLLAMAPMALAPTSAQAQQSASYTLAEHDLNEGGNPAGGAVPASASFRLTVDALGGTLRVTDASSASFQMDAGFVPPYRPPGEVTNLRFLDTTTIVWDPEESVGDYDVYRGLLSTLPGGYGSCLESRLATATASDPDIPPAGACFYYLVTAENRLDEEGTKGFTSLGMERPNATPCP